jgi:pimeloyl-ACP methyl ester carboxylesterase
VNTPMQNPAHVVFVPGMLNTADIWSAVMAKLPSQVHCHVANITTQDSISAMARDVWGLMQAIPMEAPIVLVGFSLGGYVSLEMLAHPQRALHAAVFVSTSARPETPEGKLARESMIDALERDFGSVADSVATRGLHPDHLTLKPELLAGMTSLGAAVAIRQTRAIMQRADHRARLASVNTAVHILCGLEDKVVPPKFSDELHTLFSNSRLQKLSPCAHMLPIEQADALAQSILHNAP